MPRKLFARGARGDIVKQIQEALLAAGHDPQGTDGIYGGDTVTAIQSFQQTASLPVTGEVDDATWAALIAGPIPGIDRRSLQLTAAFEGHNYTLAKGNFDGAWLTWGIIGFTMKFGQVQQIVLNINGQDPGLLQQAFGTAEAAELVRVMSAAPPEQRTWADSVTVAGGNLAEPWLSGFARFGEMEPVRQEQRRAARVNYYQPAEQTAAQLGVRSELGLALCFDIHVQNGAVSAAVRQNIRQQIGNGSAPPEPQLRQIIANAVADNAKPQFVADVRTRKLAIATGAGTVHGRAYVLENWGLSEAF